MKFIAIYTTFNNKEAAIKFGRKIIRKKLAACVNIIPRVYSIYPWDGKIEEDEESIMILKTTDKNKEQILSLIRTEHPYDLPAFLVYPIQEGSKEYLDWIEKQSRGLDIN
ncbi:MAG: divalent-cation tolerance protein CutA [Candidatus Hodarchaeales archaeon]